MSVPLSLGSATRLKGVVEVVVDWDVADRDEAKQLVIRQPPGNGLLLIAQYRERVSATRQFGSDIETYTNAGFFFCRSASAMPTAIGRPWPSEPPEISMPGV